jgi:hypothetical protein
LADFVSQKKKKDDIFSHISGGENIEKLLLKKLNLELFSFWQTFFFFISFVVQRNSHIFKTKIISQILFFILRFISDRYFIHRLKIVIFLCFLLGGICNLIFTFMFHIPGTDEIFFPVDKWVVVLVISFMGFFQGVCDPLLLEFCAELTFPTPEGIKRYLFFFPVLNILDENFTIMVPRSVLKI